MMVEGSGYAVVDIRRCVRVASSCLLTMASGMAQFPRDRTRRVIGAAGGSQWSVLRLEFSTEVGTGGVISVAYSHNLSDAHTQESESTTKAPRHEERQTLDLTGRLRSVCCAAHRRSTRAAFRGAGRQGACPGLPARPGLTVAKATPRPQKPKHQSET